MADEGVARVGLLQGFELSSKGELVSLPLSAQRVVAFLALHDRPVHRLYVAGTLWLNSTEAKANACLRTALWRLRTPECHVVEATSTHLELAKHVEVDVRETKAAAEQAIGHEVAPGDYAAATLYRAGELLPDWYEDWVLVEREHFRQLRLHALEALCADLTAAGRFGEAARAGLAAIKGEPLRESAHRVLIATYLAEGNPGEALRQYRLFRRLLAEQLGLEPSHLMVELMAALPIQ
jgi:DNA-binding SARP family transcriptional activator